MNGLLSVTYFSGYACLLHVAFSCTPFEGGARDQEQPSAKETPSKGTQQQASNKSESASSEAGSTSTSPKASAASMMKPLAATGGSGGSGGGPGGAVHVDKPDDTKAKDSGAEPTSASMDAGHDPQSGPGIDQDHALDLGMIEAAAVVQKRQIVGPQTPKAWYRFKLGENGTLTYGATGVASGETVSVLLFPAATLVKFDAPYASVNANSNNGVAEIYLEQGDYYVVAKPYNVNVSSLYDLSLSFEAYAYAEPSSGDPGDDKEHPCDLGTLTGLKTYGGYVGGTDVSDFYRFTLEDNSRFQLAITEIKGYVSYDLYADAEILNPDKPLGRGQGQTKDVYPTQTQPAGVYYLKIYQYGAYQGLYKLSITPKE